MKAVSYTHLGAVNKHGQTIPNYHYEDLRLLYELYMKRNLKNPACIVDTNHSNSGKQYMEQIRKMCIRDSNSRIADTKSIPSTFVR